MSIGRISSLQRVSLLCKDNAESRARRGKSWRKTPVVLCVTACRCFVSRSLGSSARPRYRIEGLQGITRTTYVLYNQTGSPCIHLANQLTTVFTLLWNPIAHLRSVAGTYEHMPSKSEATHSPLICWHEVCQPSEHTSLQAMFYQSCHRLAATCTSCRIYTSFCLCLSLSFSLSLRHSLNNKSTSNTLLFN